MASDGARTDPSQQSELADRVVRTTFEAYQKLPKHGKPIIRANGVPEWTILASISVVIHSKPDPNSDDDERVSVRDLGSAHTPHGSVQILPVGLGTGVKVLPFVKLPPAGDTVHDCHAEVLARRGLCRWLLQQAILTAEGKSHAGVLHRDPATQRFSLRSGVQLWLYVSALPCGDASTLHTAVFQPTEMAALKSLNESSLRDEPGPATSRGRNGYSSFGALRTKPGRTDSPPTISMSCSDKIATWSALGLQGALLSGLFDPVYLDHIIIGGALEPPSQLPNGQQIDRTEWREVMHREAARACFGRLATLDRASRSSLGYSIDCTGRLPAPFRLHRPVIHLTPIEFAFSKPSMTRRGDEGPEAIEPVTSPKCLLSVRDMVPEILFNGARQGVVWKPPGLIAMVEKARSAVCKLEMMRSFLELRDAVQAPSGAKASIDKETLYNLKHHTKGGSSYQAAKRLLRGAPVSGAGLVQGAFERCRGVMVTIASPSGGEDTAEPPFAGWLVSGLPFEGFDRNGRIYA